MSAQHKDKNEPITLERLTRLNDSIDFCNVEYTSELEDGLEIPGEIKTAWCAYSDAKQTFKEVLAKYKIELK